MRLNRGDRQLEMYHTSLKERVNKQLPSLIAKLKWLGILKVYVKVPSIFISNYCWCDFSCSGGRVGFTYGFLVKLPLVFIPKPSC